MEKVSGGVCAAQGFTASGIYCGIRKNKTKSDLALIYSQVRAAAAAVYTQNLVKGAPLLVTKEHISDGFAQSIICNSGNANTCNANGLEIAEQTCTLVADELKITPEDVIVASTGVIGQQMSIAPFRSGIPKLVAGLSTAGGSKAAEAIMTTDTVMKEVAVSFELDGKRCMLGGIAKGSGMIHPNMATMLVFITTDVAISPAMLQYALSIDVQSSFNMVSIDGDTSTNDMVAVLANGMAGNTLIEQAGPALDTFMAALNCVTVDLCKKIAADGEGASKMLQCQVKGAKDATDAKLVAKSIIASSLVKSAMFGADANWGRVLCAIGYSGADVDVSKVDVAFSSSAGKVEVCMKGAGIDFSEDLAKQVLSEKEIDILVSLHDGTSSATAWGCDLTYDYVKINGDYRT